MTRRMCQTGLVLATLIMSAATAQGNTTAVEKRDATIQRSVLVAYILRTGEMDLKMYYPIPFIHVMRAEGIGHVYQKTFKIRQEGVYLVSLRLYVLYNDLADFHLLVNDAFVGVAAFGGLGAVAAVDAALGLYRDDELRVISRKNVWLKHRSMITVVFLAPLEEPGTLIENCKNQSGLCPNGESADVRPIGQNVSRCCMGFDLVLDRYAQCTCRKRPEERYTHFFTGRQREERKAGPGTLNFNVVLGDFGGFKRKSTSQFTAPLTGIYWIAIRIDPERNKEASGSTIAWVETSTGLMAVYGKVPVSAASAIRLNQGTQFTVKNTEERPTGSETIFSVVFLTFNRKPYTGSADYLAFTGYQSADDDNQILFFRTVQLDAGGMDQNFYARFTIKQTGVYLVSLRPVSTTSNDLTLNLKVNGNHAWRAFQTLSWYHTSQTTALILTASDEVLIKSDWDLPVGKGTMFSIAFVHP